MSMLPESRFFQQAYFNSCKIYCNKASISCFTMASCVALSIAPPVAEEVELLEPEDLNSRCSACRFSLETSSAHWLSASQLEYSIFWLAFTAFPDRKSTRLNSSHVKISYAVFCLKK